MGLPSPLGRGWSATALSPAVAGRVRGHLHGEERGSADPVFGACGFSIFVDEEPQTLRNRCALSLPLDPR
jgi:hypothetical protein